MRLNCYLRTIFAFSCLSAVVCEDEWDARTFPDNFMFGVATAAYQIEGGWDEDFKGENIWDRFVHQNSSVIDDNQNADVACDSYHKYKEDVALLADLGVSHYRFSISWARILPTGFDDHIQYKGISYYQNLLSELEQFNIVPVVTLYHWDLPQSLQEMGGWLNSTIVDRFTDYARVIFGTFGDRVKYWITINEPKQVCTSGYGKGSMAPGLKEDGTADYICAYNVLKAHATAYHLYKELDLNGSVSIALDGVWPIPASTKQEDQDAAARKLQFEVGLYANPIFNGDWPETVKERIEYRSKNENKLGSSRLPTFTKDEVEYIKGTVDYMAFNFYEAIIVENTAEDSDFTAPALTKDLRVATSKDLSWERGSNGNAIVPWAFKSILRWIKTNYNNPAILITENGVGDDGSTLDDNKRIKFIVVSSVSIALDGVWPIPASTKQEDQDAAARKLQFEVGLYANPIFNGDWPETVKERIEYRSKNENKLGSSRLPTFTKDEVEYIKGTVDYMAFNFYEAIIVENTAEDSDFTAPALTKDLRVATSKDLSWERGSNGNAIVPWAFKSILRWIKTNYNNPAILITENGVGDDGSTLDDNKRIKFIVDYLMCLLEAIKEDGVNVFGYTHWSLMDNFEWNRGYRSHFGLYAVNFTDDNRPRTSKKSARFYNQIATTLYVPEVDDDAPSTTVASTTKEVSNSVTDVTSQSSETTIITEISSTEESPTTPGAAFIFVNNYFITITIVVTLVKLN